MSIVANEGKDVLVSYNYMLRVEGLYDLPCKMVHSFKKANAFEYVQEGGLNDYVHMLRKPISEYFSFTVERYVGTDPYPVLPLGAELVLPVILMISPHPNRFDVSKRTFVFTGCTVMNKTYGELNAEKSGILTETIEIGYREMVEVTIPMATGGDTAKRWAFDKSQNSDHEGNKQMSAHHYELDAQSPLGRHWDIKTHQSLAKLDSEAQLKSLTEKQIADERAKMMTELFSQKKKSKNDLKTIANWRGSANTYNLDKERATVRKWEKNPNDKVLGGGTASALHYELDKERATIRRWEEVSKKKTDDDTEGVKWSIKNKNENRKAAQNGIDDKRAVVRQWDISTHIEKKNKPVLAQMRSKVDRILKKEDSGREWAASARTNDNDVDAARATVRRWEMVEDDFLGEGVASARNTLSSKATSRKGGFKTREEEVSAEAVQSGMKNDAAQGAAGSSESSKWSIKNKNENRKAAQNGVDGKRATVRKWETADDNTLGGGNASAFTNKTDSERATVRKWETPDDNTLGGGNASAFTNKTDSKRMTARKWETADDNKLGGGNASAMQSPSSKANARKGGYKSIEEQQPPAQNQAARKWETPDDNKLGGGKASAKQSPSSKAKNRKWTIKKEASSQSAVTEKDTKAKGRKWEFSESNVKGAGKASAKQEPSTKAEGRKWPAVSSAKKRQE